MATESGIDSGVIGIPRNETKRNEWNDPDEAHRPFSPAVPRVFPLIPFRLVYRPEICVSLLFSGLCLCCRDLAHVPIHPILSPSSLVFFCVALIVFFWGGGVCNPSCVPFLGSFFLGCFLLLSLSLSLSLGNPTTSSSTRRRRRGRRTTRRKQHPSVLHRRFSRPTDRSHDRPHCQSFLCWIRRRLAHHRKVPFVSVNERNATGSLSTPRTTEHNNECYCITEYHITGHDTTGMQRNAMQSLHCGQEEGKRERMCNGDWV